MRSIGVVTVGRSDYGIYLPVLRRIEQDPDLRLCLFVSGMHLSPEFGMTVRQIEDDGFRICERLEMLLSSDSPEGLAKSTGLGIIAFAQVYARVRPDILVVLGDRFEMLAAVVGALPFRIPTAHIHGGESTEGLIDEPIRHSITKMSHLHFVSNDVYQQRLLRMGEEPWRVVVSGAPSLDNLSVFRVLERDALEERYALNLSADPLLVTYHPVTLEHDRTTLQVGELLGALEEIGMRVVFTYPNADTSGRAIIGMIERFCSDHPWAQVAVSLGPDAYFSLMRCSAAMVGNSSSGLIEAASFRLPVVNIGNRQRGRLRAENVIDVGYPGAEIVAGIRRAVSPAFRQSLDGLVNPYGDGHASERIVARLKEIAIDDELLLKRFHD